MLAIIRFGFTWLFNLIFRAGVVKFVVGTAIVFLLEWLTGLALQLLGNYTGQSLGNAFGSIASDALYFMGVLRLDIGLPMILGAYVARFAIRRIPIIG